MPPESAAAAPAAATGGGLRSQAESGAIWIALEALGYRVANLAAFVVISRIVMPGELGLAAAVNLLTASFAALYEGGRGTLIVQNGTTDQRALSSSFWQCAGVGVLLAATGVLTAPWVADLFGGDHRLVPLLRLGSLVFVFSSLEVVPSALATRVFDFRRLAIRKSVAVVVGALVGVGLALAGAGPYALVAQLLAYAATSAAMIATQVPWRPSLVWDRALLRRDRRAAYELTGVSLLNVGQANLDKFLVGILLSPLALGYYTVATRAVVVLEDVTTTALFRVSVPTFTRMKAQGTTRDGLLKLTRLVVAGAVPLFLLTAAVAQPFTHLVFGLRFGPSVHVLQVLALGAAARTATAINPGVLVAAGHRRQVLWLTAAGVVVTAVVVPLTGHHGLVWVAVALCGREVVLAVPRVTTMCRAAGLPVRDWGYAALVCLAPGAVAGAVAFGVAQLLGARLPAAVVLVVSGAAGAVLLLPLLRVFCPPVAADIGATGRRITARLQR